MTTLHEKAVALLAYLKDKNHWTTGELACGDSGGTLNPLNPRATCHCLLGGIAKIEGTSGNLSRYDVMSYSAIANTPLGKAVHSALPETERTERPQEDLYAFNDGHSHADIVKLLKKVVNKTKEAP